MNQEKIGKFLKELRKKKGLTQEQIAEKFNVSNRTISRWENGNNMPDLDILIEISDYYEVDLREILNGERKSENMDKEMKETVLRAVDYTNAEAELPDKKQDTKREMPYFITRQGMSANLDLSLLYFISVFQKMKAKWRKEKREYG